jgi:hypothetical protein
LEVASAIPPLEDRLAHDQNPRHLRPIRRTAR